jgi:hypothetical protein
MKILPVCAVLIIWLGNVGMSFVSAQKNDATNKDGVEQDGRKLNADEVAAFLNNDPKALARVWSGDFVVTNPLNKFVSKQQVLGMIQSGFLVITILRSADRICSGLR